VHGGSEHAQAWERIDSLLKSFWVQGPSNARDIIGSLAIMPEMLKPSEYGIIVQGLEEAFRSGSSGKAIKSGSLKPSRNLNPTVIDEASDVISRITEITQRTVGAEALNKIHRIWMDSVGRLKAIKAINEGDTAYLDKFGPNDWQKWKHVLR